MKCDKIREKICELIDGELKVESEEAVKEHISACDECSKEYEKLSKAVKLLRDIEPLDAPPDIIVNVNNMLDEGSPLEKVRRFFACINAPRFPLKTVAIAIVAVMVIYLSYKDPATVDKLRDSALRTHYEIIDENASKMDKIEPAVDVFVESIIETDTVKREVASEPVRGGKDKVAQPTKEVKELKKPSSPPLSTAVGRKKAKFKKEAPAKVTEDARAGRVKEAPATLDIELDNIQKEPAIKREPDAITDKKPKSKVFKSFAPKEEVKSQLTYRDYGDDTAAEAFEESAAETPVPENEPPAPVGGLPGEPAGDGYAYKSQLAEESGAREPASPPIAKSLPQRRNELLNGEKTIPAYDRTFFADDAYEAETGAFLRTQPEKRAEVKERRRVNALSVEQQEVKAAGEALSEAETGDRLKVMGKMKRSARMDKDIKSKAKPAETAKKGAARENYFRFRVKDLIEADSKMRAIFKKHGAAFLFLHEDTAKKKMTLMFLVPVKSYNELFLALRGEDGFNLTGRGIKKLKLAGGIIDKINEISKNWQDDFLTIEFELTL